MDKFYGSIEFANGKSRSWILTDVAPHAAIQLRRIFHRFSSSGRKSSFVFDDNLDNAVDLDWFMSRYPLEMSAKTKRVLRARLKEKAKLDEDCEKVLSGNYNSDISPQVIYPNEFRPHQQESAELGAIVKRLLVVDDVGMGKSYSLIAACLKALPAVVVCDPVNQDQFLDKFSGFVNLKVHKAEGTKPKERIPSDADIVLLKYNQLNGWYKSVIDHGCVAVHFDEVQNLRHGAQGSTKGRAAKAMADALEYVLGYTATLTYNYGVECWNILDVINPGLLGSKEEFVREWCSGDEKRVSDPDALGFHLIDSRALIRHKKPKDESRYPVSEIIEVEPDFNEIESAQDLAKDLAMKVLTTTDFNASGVLSREFDIQMRKITGLAKARHAALAAKMLLEQGRAVILFGFHHEVYRIWEKELADQNPYWYTGKQTNAQKNKSKKAFMDGTTNLLIMSIRTGVGVDGLQQRAPWIVFGELDWSKQIHLQNIGRGDRDGNPDPESCGSVYITTEYGSDPIMLSVLDIKSKQNEGIQNPKTTSADNALSGGLMAGRFKEMAEAFLASQNIKLDHSDDIRDLSNEQLAILL